MFIYATLQYSKNIWILQLIELPYSEIIKMKNIFSSVIFKFLNIYKLNFSAVTFVAISYLSGQ